MVRYGFRLQAAFPFAWSACEQIGPEHGYPGGFPAAILVDREGNVWVRTLDGAVLFLAPVKPNFNALNTTPAPPLPPLFWLRTTHYTFLHEAPDGSIWLSDDHGLRRVTNEALRVSCPRLPPREKKKIFSSETLPLPPTVLCGRSATKACGDLIMSTSGPRRKLRKVLPARASPPARAQLRRRLEGVHRSRGHHMGRDQLRPRPASTHRPLDPAASPGSGTRLQHPGRRSRLDMDRKQEPAPNPCGGRWPDHQLSQDARDDLYSTRSRWQHLVSRRCGRPPVSLFRLRVVARAVSGERAGPGHFSGYRSKPGSMDLYGHRRSLPFRTRQVDPAERDTREKTGHPGNDDGGRGRKCLVWLLQLPGRMGWEWLSEILFPQRHARCFGNDHVGTG